MGYAEEHIHTVEYSKHNKSENQVRARYCQNKAVEILIIHIWPWPPVAQSEKGKLGKLHNFHCLQRNSTPIAGMSFPPGGSFWRKFLKWLTNNVNWMIRAEKNPSSIALYRGIKTSGNIVLGFHKCFFVKSRKLRTWYQLFFSKST